MQKSLILTLILAIIIGVFALSNSAAVEINFIFAEVVLSQAIVIFISVLLGAIAAVLLGIFREHKLKKTIKEEKFRISELEKELSDSRTLIDSKEEKLKLLYARGDSKVVETVEKNDFSGN